MSTNLWPRSILNERNCKLHDAIDSLTNKIQESETALEQAKTELCSFEDIRSRVEREKRNCEVKKKEYEVSLSNTKSLLLTLSQQNCELKNSSLRLKEQYEEADRKLQAIVNTCRKKEELYLRSQEELMLMEEIVKELSLSQQRLLSTSLVKSNKENAAVRNLEYSLWEKVKRATERLTNMEHVYQQEKQSYENLCQESEHIKRTRQDTFEAHNNIITEIKFVEEETFQMDKQIILTAAAMEALKKDKYDRNRDKQETCDKNNELCSDVGMKRKMIEHKVKKYNAVLTNLRSELQASRQQAMQLAFLQKQKELISFKEIKRQEHNLEQMRELLEDKKSNELFHLESYAKEITAIRERLYKENSSEQKTYKLLSSVKEMELMELNKWNSQCERIKKRLEQTYNHIKEKFLVREQQTTQINVLKAQMQNVQRAEHSLTSELLSSTKSNQKLMEAVNEIENKLRKEMIEKENCHAAQQHKTKQEIQELREQSEHLLAVRTNLKSQILRSESKLLYTQNLIEQNKKEMHNVHEFAVNMTTEITELQKESKRLTSLQEDTLWKNSLNNAEVETLRLLARDLALKEGELSTTTEEHRGEYQKLLIELSSQEQMLLTALHLEQQVLHEYKDELTRDERKRELLKIRYEETVNTLTLKEELYQYERNFQRATPVLCTSTTSQSNNAFMNCKQEKPATFLIDRFTEDNELDRMHARHILARSCEREELLSKGNYLDDRIISLERETTTLKQMLKALRINSTHRAPTGIETDQPANYKLTTNNFKRNQHNLIETKSKSENNSFDAQKGIDSKRNKNIEINLIRQEIALQEELIRSFNQDQVDLRTKVHLLKKKYTKLLQQLKIKRAFLRRKAN